LVHLHTDVEQWPTWNAEVTAATLDGPFAAGRSFTWTSYDLTVTSTIYEVQQGARTLWGGAAQGIMGAHEWLFEPTGEGVHVTTHESFAGDPVEADTAGLQALLDSSLAAGGSPRAPSPPGRLARPLPSNDGCRQ
jgi:hypothetical protein